MQGETLVFEVAGREGDTKEAASREGSGRLGRWEGRRETGGRKKAGWEGGRQVAEWSHERALQAEMSRGFDVRGSQS